ncbi:MAG: DUF4403 family protein [Alphaproteobacteria bacterium]|nr:DUF4403 family protein [Alphaproteobacteria bacterium]
MRRILLGGLVVAVAFVAALVLMSWLWPSAPTARPPLAEMPPLKPATRTSTVIAPAAIALSAIRDALDAQAPRDLSGKRDNPIGQLLQNAELGWSINRGPLAVTGRPEGLSVVAPLNGAFRLTGQIGSQVGNITSQLGGILGGSVGEQLGNLTGKALDQRADIRGNVMLNARPVLQPNWRIEPNLSGQANLNDTSLSVAGVRINVGKEVKPLIDRAVGEQVGALQARLRNDPMIEVVARREWGKMCRSIPLGKATPGVPDLWLEVRPTRAVAAQPKIDASALTLTIGVQAETRISAVETKPDCPFPATVEIVPPMEQGRLSLGVPIDMPFTEVNKLIEAQLKGKTFPEDRQGPALVTINGATVTPSGERLLISLRVKATETKSWFGFGAAADVHVWGKPVLDAANQTLRLADLTVDVQSQEAFGLLGAAARAALPYLKDALAAHAQIDLKPFAANALKSIDAAIANFRNQQPGVAVDAAVSELRLAGIEFDAKTLRIIGEVEGTVRVAISTLPK